MPLVCKNKNTNVKIAISTKNYKFFDSQYKKLQTILSNIKKYKSKLKIKINTKKDKHCGIPAYLIRAGK